MKKIFSIHDEKAGAFLSPFIAENAAVAGRMLEPIANDRDSMLSRFAVDYSVYCVGGFNEQTGEVSGQLPHEYCFRLVDLKRDRGSMVPAVLESESKKEDKLNDKKA